MENIGLIIILLLGLVWIVGVSCTIISMIKKDRVTFNIRPKPKRNIVLVNYQNIDDTDSAGVIILDE